MILNLDLNHEKYFYFQQFYQDGARIEAAFRKYFHRASVSQTSDSYEVVVCHANVIRYFVCRQEGTNLPLNNFMDMNFQDVFF